MVHLKDIWEDPTKRNWIVGIIGMVLLGVVFNTVFLADVKPMERKKRAESYTKNTLFSNDQINRIDEKELNKLYSNASVDLQKREKDLKRDKAEMEELVKDWQDRMDEQEFKNKDNARLMKMLVEGRLGLDDVVNIKKNDVNNSSRKSQRNKSDQLPIPFLPVPIDNSLRNAPTQVLTQESAVSGNVIRTVTQRSVRQVRQSGEVNEVDYTNNYLSASSQTLTNEADNIKEKEKKAILKKEEENFIYLPSGSFFSAVMITGLNAPTSMAADKSPMPVVFRIKKEAVLPNNFRSDIRDCHAIGEAVGDLATERANIRLVNISCITNEGVAVESSINAVAVNDYDGIVGVSGELVTKNGNLLAGSMMASFMSSLSNAVQPQQTRRLATGNDANMWETFDGKGTASNAVFGGLSGATDKLAEYYMNLADAMHPVINIPPGRGVTFMVLKGTKLNFSSQK